MCYERHETKAYYEFQIERGEWDNFGGRTNLDHVCFLAKRPGVSASRVLDIGCGDGDVAEALRGCGITWSEYRGVDAVPTLLHRFNIRKLTAMQAIVGDVTDLSAVAD